MPGKIIRPALSIEVGIFFSTLWIEYIAHWNLVGWAMPGTPVQPPSVSFIDCVASSTNITFKGIAEPPALAADAVDVSVMVGKPNALRKCVVTDAVCVTVATFEVVPLQVGRFAVAVLHETATLVLPIAIFAGGFAVFQAVTAAVTVVRLALVARSALAPAIAAAWVAALNSFFETKTCPTSKVSPAVPINPTSMKPNSTAVAPALSRKRPRRPRGAEESERFIINILLLNY